MTKKIVCDFCGYKWRPKVKAPVSCPKCKRRFDYVKLPKKKVGA